jgi:hypothetical protein
MPKQNEELAWLSVIARSLAFLCLHAADVRDKDLVTQATLLDSLGLIRRDTAALLGSTEESIRVVFWKAQKGKGGRGGSKKSQRKESK